MIYKIQFHGWGVELICGTCSEIMYKHFKENQIDVSDYMSGEMEDELSEDIHQGLTMETKYENDSLYHNFGPLFNSNTTIFIKNEKDEPIYSSSLEYKNGDKWYDDCEQEFIVNDCEEKYVIVGQEYTKGFQAEYLLHLKDDEEFDQSKLCILYEDFDEDVQIVTGLRYNNVDLECTGESSTTGKSATWFIRDTENNEETYW
jgi:hypothetical protein